MQFHEGIWLHLFTEWLIYCPYLKNQSMNVYFSGFHKSICRSSCQHFDFILKDGNKTQNISVSDYLSFMEDIWAFKSSLFYPRCYLSYFQIELFYASFPDSDGKTGIPHSAASFRNLGPLFVYIYNKVHYNHHPVTLAFGVTQLSTHLNLFFCIQSFLLSRTHRHALPLPCIRNRKICHQSLSVF